MGQTTRTYALDDVTLVLGTNLITEFVKGEAITCSKDDDDWTVTQGSHGAVCRAKKHNNIGTVVIRTMQGSPTNKLISDMLKADLADGAKSFALQLKDNRGAAVVSAPQCFFLKPADMAFGEEVGQREYTVKCGHLSMDDGANASA